MTQEVGRYMPCSDKRSVRERESGGESEVGGESERGAGCTRRRKKKKERQRPMVQLMSSDIGCCFAFVDCLVGVSLLSMMWSSVELCLR